MVGEINLLNFSSLALTVWERQFFNDEGVCRTDKLFSRPNKAKAADDLPYFYLDITLADYKCVFSSSCGQVPLGQILRPTKLPRLVLVLVCLLLLGNSLVKTQCLKRKKTKLCATKY